MDIIRIGDGVLKLLLEKKDMEKHGITAAELSSDSAVRDRALRSLLDEVKTRTGVDASARRTLLEAFPDKEGGCEIFMTLLRAEKKTKEVLYRFTALADLCAVAGKFDADGHEEDSALYALGDGTYFLFLPLPEEGSGRTLSPYSFLEEYGSRERNTLYSAYVREYGTCLCATRALDYILLEKENFSV